VIRLPDLGDRGQGWVWLQAAIMAAIPTVGGLAPRWPEQLQAPMLALGLVLLLMGCALLIAGILGLGDSFAVFPAPRDQADLITYGIYDRARHPIFGGWILVGMGFGVAFSPWALPFAAMLVVGLLGKSAVEERRLSARYPAYPQYRARVRRRFLPTLRSASPEGPTSAAADRSPCAGSGWSPRRSG
jgi:protein-S-isoprenylcysteine O-methyltransferase Ste14